MKTKKVKELKSKTNDSTTINSKKSLVVKKENSVHDEVLDKQAIPMVKLITESVIKIVVGKLKPDIELAVNSKFDEIKKIFTSEVQDIRTIIENKLPNQPLEQTQVSSQVAHSPDGKVRGLENNEMRNPSSPKSTSNPIEALLPSLLQLLPSILGKSQEANASSGSMPSMLVELMMKKFVNDMGRSDTQNQAVTDYLLKQMVRRDPTILKGLSNLDITKTEKEEHY